jgi:mono/diheme cytochrome c family protein
MRTNAWGAVPPANAGDARRVSMKTSHVLRWSSIVAAAVFLFNPTQVFAADPPPYTVKDGDKVDMGTYKGFLYYGDECARCHGPGGAGSSYAPALTESLKHLTKEEFEETVINGKKEVNTASDKVMPSFGVNQDVALNLDNIYAYLKARSDGVLGRGHPEHLEQ